MLHSHMVLGTKKPRITSSLVVASFTILILKLERMLLVYAKERLSFCELTIIFIAHIIYGCLIQFILLIDVLFVCLMTYK